MYLIFRDKKFISYADSPVVPGSDFFAKEIPPEQSDLRFWKWEGDQDTGQMVNMWEQGYPPEELEAEKKLQQLIDEEYPPGVQLTLTILQLYKLISQLQSLKNNNFTFDNKFADMAETVSKLIDKQEKRFNFYSKQNFNTNE
jgi:hypothetical protein